MTGRQELFAIVLSNLLSYGLYTFNDAVALARRVMNQASCFIEEDV